MAGGKDVSTFADVINQASAFPDDPGVGASHELPALFGPGDFPIPQGDHVETEVEDPKQIKGIPAYKYTSKFQRFVMGPVSGGRDERGMPIIEEHDDSQAYEAVIDLILAGRAVQRWEERKFTNEGGMIVAMMWLLPKEKAPEKPKHDLLNPEAPSDE